MVEKHTIVSCGVKKRAKFYFLSIKGMLLCILYAKYFITGYYSTTPDNVSRYDDSVIFSYTLL